MAVEAAMGCPRSSFLSKSRTAFNVRCRSLVASLMYKSGRSLDEVGQLMGGKDHSTILHAVHSASPETKAMVERLWLGMTGKQWGYALRSPRP